MTKKENLWSIIKGLEGLVRNERNRKLFVMEFDAADVTEAWRDDCPDTEIKLLIRKGRLGAVLFSTTVDV